MGVGTFFTSKLDEAIGWARKFSTIAIFFILIDIELMFVWPWAVIYRRLGWFGFAEMMVFLGVLMLGFLYIWRKGGLEWD